MTRDEAIGRVRAVKHRYADVRMETLPGPQYVFTDDEATTLVRQIEALGLIKFDEPKTVEQDAAAYLVGFEATIDFPTRMDGVRGKLNPSSAVHLVEFLKDGGFTIARKQ